jgi:hypothetical protein
MAGQARSGGNAAKTINRNMRENNAHIPAVLAIVKICRSFVSETQTSQAIAKCRSIEGLKHHVETFA